MVFNFNVMNERKVVVMTTFFLIWEIELNK